MMLTYISAAAASMIAAITHLFMMYRFPRSLVIVSAAHGPKSRPRVAETTKNLLVLICIRIYRPNISMGLYWVRNMFKHFRDIAGLIVLGCVTVVGEASAAGMAEPWQVDLQTPASPVAEQIRSFNAILFSLEALITLVVLGLMGFIIWRFNAKRNPVPNKRTHNTALEILWTVVPILILVVVAFPSLRLLFFMDRTQDAEMTIKVVGHQWYWSYEYPDHGDFTFDSIMIPDDELKPGQPRLLAVDNPVVVPVGVNVRVLLTSDDVIHSWAVPSLGLKTDTVPGRTNETWVNVNEEGTYYGMCSELCGINHGYMPVAVKAVSKAEFDAWSKNAKQEFARNDGQATHVVQAVGEVSQ